MTNTLYTIGYEGADIDAFVATLLAAGICHVIDVRDVPASRKRGFSKTALAGLLAATDIAYTHLKPLGDPKAGRDAMKRGDRQAFLDVFSTHVSLPDAQSALDTAVVLATETPSVLLCFERDPRHCHRTIVAGLIGDRGSFTVRHLGVNSPVPGIGGRDGSGAKTANAVARD